MILVRDVFQAKFGKIDELVALFKTMLDEAPADMPAGFRNARILVDASGPFFTAVMETEFESMAQWEAAFSKMMSMQGPDDPTDRMNELVRSGYREFFRIER
jgi:hypothetical protein